MMNTKDRYSMDTVWQMADNDSNPAPFWQFAYWASRCKARHAPCARGTRICYSSLWPKLWPIDDNQLIDGQGWLSDLSVSVEVPFDCFFFSVRHAAEPKVTGAEIWRTNPLVNHGTFMRTGWKCEHLGLWTRMLRAIVCSFCFMAKSDQHHRSWTSFAMAKKTHLPRETPHPRHTSRSAWSFALSVYTVAMGLIQYWVKFWQCLLRTIFWNNHFRWKPNVPRVCSGYEWHNVLFLFIILPDPPGLTGISLQSNPGVPDSVGRTLTGSFGKGNWSTTDGTGTPGSVA